MTQQRTMEFRGQRPTGFFNTFRLGRKWADLAEGEQLTLTSDSAIEGGQVPYARAAVLHVDAGPIEDMMQAHAWLNHGVGHLAEPEDRRVALWDTLEGVYGRPIRAGTVVTVVHLLAEETSSVSPSTDAQSPIEG